MFLLSLAYFRHLLHMLSLEPGLVGLACKFNKLIHCDGHDCCVENVTTKCQFVFIILKYLLVLLNPPFGFYCLILFFFFPKWVPLTLVLR